MVIKSYYIILEISLLIIFSGLAFAQEALIPFQEVYYGEPLVLKYTLVQESTGDPILGASIRARTDFFDIYLLDDGQHEDGNANDGVYGNVVNATAEEGVYTIAYTINVVSPRITRTTSGSFKILPKPSKPLLNLKLIGYILIGAVAFGVGSFFLYKKLMGKKVVENKIKSLKKEKGTLMEMMKKAENEYYTRVIDEKTFTARVEKYKEEIIRIDLELKNLEAQTKAPETTSA